MRESEEILEVYTSRLKTQGDMHGAMREIKTIYENEADIPLPDMDQTQKPAVPNLLAQGVDQMAGRIASVIPQVWFASRKAGDRAADRRATTANNVIGAWWKADSIPAKMRYRARHLVAYGMAPVVVKWNHKQHRPTWQVRSPLETFPAPDLIPGCVVPNDALFAYRRSVGWLKSMGWGPQVAQVLGTDECDPDTSMLLLEHVDEDGTHLVVTGYGQGSSPSLAGAIYADSSLRRSVTLAIAVNPAGIQTAVIPTRFSLSRAAGQFDTMTGMYYMGARLMALEVLAVEKGIFPDTYLESRPGETARILDGPHDGRTGLITTVQGGTIREVGTNPGYQTNPTIDRIERAQRLTAGIPSEFGGESGSNIRTGRRGDAVMSAVIDFPVGEAQEAFAMALEAENRAAIALAKAYDGTATRSFYVGTGNQTKPVTFVANEVFPHSEHSVSYPVAGTDLNGLMIGLGQRVGMGTMSKRSAALLDPYIDNPEVEHDLIIAEGLEQALVSGIQQQAASGAIPPLVLAKIMSLVASDRMELAEALTKVTEEAAAAAQQDQAAQQGPPTADQMMAPAAAQSLSGSPIPGASQGQLDLGTLMSTLRKPAMTIQPGRGIAQGAQ